ncbi:MAG: hypothetical protein U0133_10910 [Gemmatimonadales bacterium]
MVVAEAEGRSRTRQGLLPVFDLEEHLAVAGEGILVIGIEGEGALEALRARA